ncbi:MAG TPA: C40 family peptidase [Longimicrobiales bacterium]|nr:C40 family peptidase [Longimicrobiales bacterium]
MNQVIPGLVLLAVLPGVAHAQISIDFSSGVPVVRANVAGIPVSASIGSTGRINVRLDDRARTTTGARRSSANATASSVLATADDYIGTKYVWGGATPRGFDCSGFVQYVFRRHGIELPRTSRQQAQVGRSVATSLGSMRVGDLMFFATDGNRVDHIAIYAGNDEIIHSSSSGGGVGYDNFSTKRGRWFVDHHVATRRVIADGESLVGPLTAALRALAEFDPPDRAPKR